MFSFAAPLALFGLISLPMIYWLLRVTPPRPREVVFPPTKILRELKPDEETPAKTPRWLMALRLALAAALIFAMAGPVGATSGVVASSAPTLVILERAWTAGPREATVAGATSIIESVARAAVRSRSRSHPRTARPFQATCRARWKSCVRRGQRPLLSAGPYRQLANRSPPSLTPIGRRASYGSATETAQGDAADFVRVMKASGAAGVEVYVEDHSPRALAAPTNDAAALSVDVLRIGDEPSAVVDALDAKGRTVGRATVDFGGAPRVRAKIELPVELRNDVSHLRIEGENSAGAVALLDARSKVKRVALIGGAADEAQPLLSPLYYLEKALAPFAQIRTARPGVVDPVQALLAEQPNILGLADVGLAPGETFDAVSRFVEEGGTLIRFAGPRLANADDGLLPVRLRRNGRVLGGAMSWEEPKALGRV